MKPKKTSQFKRRDIRLSVFLRAEPERVYAALSDARELERWWLAEAETDPRNLGRFRLSWPAGVLGPGLGRSPWLKEGRGVFVDLEPGRKVAWAWDRGTLPRGVPPLTSVFIEPKPGGCQATVIHSGFPADARSGRIVAACERLWRDCLQRLADHQLPARA